VDLVEQVVNFGESFVDLVLVILLISFARDTNQSLEGTHGRSSINLTTLIFLGTGEHTAKETCGGASDLSLLQRVLIKVGRRAHHLFDVLKLVGVESTVVLLCALAFDSVPTERLEDLLGRSVDFNLHIQSLIKLVLRVDNVAESIVV
jgi:hypothetical protein